MQPVIDTPVAEPQRKQTVSSKIVTDWMSSLPKLGEQTAAPTATPPTPPAASAAPAAAATPNPTPEPTQSATPPEPEKAEAAPDPAQPAATKPEEAEEKWPRNASDWDKFKSKKATQLKAKDEEIAKLAAKVAEFEKQVGQTQSNPEFEMTKKERDELSEKLRLVSIENHPKFKAYFDNKINSQIELAKRIVGKDKADDVARILSLPDSDIRSAKLDELVAELPPMHQSRLGSVLNALEQISVERKSEMDKAKQDYEVVTARAKEEAERTVKERQQKINSAFDSALKHATDPKDGLFVFQKRDGDDQWNQAVEQRIGTARNLLFGNNDQDTLLKAAFAAVSFPAMLESHKKLHEENTSLKAQIASLQAATPKVTTNGGSGGSTDNPPPEPAKRGTERPRDIATGWMKDLHDARKRAMSGE